MTTITHRERPEVAHDARRTLLTTKEVLAIKPHEAEAPFPEKQAKALRIFDHPEPPRYMSFRTHDPIIYSKRDQKILSERYRAAPKPVAEGDHFDVKAVSRDASHRSISGVRPKHLPFDPIPAAALIDPRLRGLVQQLQNGPMTPRIRIDHFPTTIYPWCTVGKIFKAYPPYTSDALYASGFMFGGQVMITARHVFPSDIHDTFDGDARYRFVPGWDGTSSNPEPFGSAMVTMVRGKEKNNGILWDTVNGWDYAICKLDNRVGDISGSMGVCCFKDSDDYKDRFYSSAGYPEFNNGNPVQEILANIRDVDGGYRERELESKNFAGPGWSGGPLFGYVDEFGGSYVVGVCSGKEFFDSLLPPWSNLVFAGGRRFVDLAQYAVDNWWT